MVMFILSGQQMAPLAYALSWTWLSWQGHHRSRSLVCHGERVWFFYSRHGFGSSLVFFCLSLSLPLFFSCCALSYRGFLARYIIFWRPSSRRSYINQTEARIFSPQQNFNQPNRLKRSNPDRIYRYDPDEWKRKRKKEKNSTLNRQEGGGGGRFASPSPNESTNERAPFLPYNDGGGDSSTHNNALLTKGMCVDVCVCGWMGVCATGFRETGGVRTWIRFRWQRRMGLGLYGPIPSTPKKEEGWMACRIGDTLWNCYLDAE